MDRNPLPTSADTLAGAETAAGGARLTRRHLLRLAGLAMAGGGACAAGGGAYAALVETRALAVERHRIPVRGLPAALDGFRIVQLSDLHLKPFTTLDLIRQAVAMANALRPDLVVLTGDFVLLWAEVIHELAPVLAGLDARHGVFAILGNHDLWTDAAVVTAGLEAVGLPVLVNRGIGLSVGRSALYLAGLDDCWSGKPQLMAAMDGHRRLPSGTPVVLLAHEPDTADTFRHDGRIALQLSGHSHGGQIRLPMIGAPILPRMGRKYDMGLKRAGGMWVYTTRGVGVIGPPVRFNCPPEVTELTLVAGDPAAATDREAAGRLSGAAP